MPGFYTDKYGMYSLIMWWKSSTDVYSQERGEVDGEVWVVEEAGGGGGWVVWKGG